MLWITLAITGSYFSLRRFCYSGLPIRYQESDKRKAFYFPHNNKLELLWTAVPAIFLTVLVSFGLYYWFKITGEAPKDAMVVEITGHQFGWEFRYPGKMDMLGRKNFRLTNAAANNPLGMTGVILLNLR